MIDRTKLKRVVGIWSSNSSSSVIKTKALIKLIETKLLAQCTMHVICGRAYNQQLGRLHGRGSNLVAVSPSVLFLSRVIVYCLLPSTRYFICNRGITDPNAYLASASGFVLSECSIVLFSCSFTVSGDRNLTVILLGARRYVRIMEARLSILVGPCNRGLSSRAGRTTTSFVK